MAIMIACSPSTGSSLLRRILNRHPKIFCGSETSLFAKAGLYKNWKRHRKGLLSGRLIKTADSSWHHFRGIRVDLEYGLSDEQIDALIMGSGSFNEFIIGFYSSVFRKTAKSIWVEKTPSNAFTAKLFLEYFEDSKVIHIVRDPYDAIASLVSRGMSIYKACAVYLLNCSKLLVLKDHPSQFMLKYEDLVNEPREVMRELMLFLGIDYSEKMFDLDQDQIGVDSMEGWKNKETAKISRSSLSRFDQLDETLKEEIIACCDLLQVSSNDEFGSVQKICSVLDYNFKTSEARSIYWWKFNFNIILDKIERTINLKYFNLFNYPIRISG